MLDLLTIFTRGGAVLWSKAESAIPESAVDGLVQDVLLEERSGQTSYKRDKYTFKWTFQNDLDLVFVAVYFHLSQFLNIDDLLDTVKREFVSLFRNDIRLVPRPKHFEKFDKKFVQIIENVENAAVDRKPKQPRNFADTKRGKERVNTDEAEANNPPSTKHSSKGDTKVDPDDLPQTPQQQKKSEPARVVVESPKPTPKSQPAAAAAVATPTNNNNNIDSPAPLSPGAPRGVSAAQLARIAKETAALQKGGPKKSSVKKPAAEPEKKKPQKVMAESRKTKKQLETELDRSTDKPSESEPPPQDNGFGPAPSPGEAYIDGDQDDDTKDEDVEVEDGDDDDDKDQREDDVKSPSSAAKPQPAKKSWFSMFKSLAGSSELSRENLTPVLENFKTTLMSKNVAQEIAEKLCESVLKSLEGKTIGTFTTVKSTVREAIEQSLTRILTPSRPIDILQGIMVAKEQNRPYSIVFVGVNGVGKSTSLAKVGAYFLSKNFKVAIVACDTFRSGAIEQLRTHATALKVPLFDRGYNRDPASVAAEGILQAQREGRDVVLIDTAGRMQDNEPLMRALSKLISVNRPDLVLFVGEALVGNDAVDQLTKFNRCLVDLSDSDQPRLIDGIVLTKFDTIDDKVGAAISMTYTTGQPIMFVGNGQTYKDLRRMNVKLLIRALLR